MELAMTFGRMHSICTGIAPKEISLAERFSHALKRAKERRRLSVKEMARMLDRTPKSVELMLAGNNSPQLDAVVRACRHFDEVWEVLAEEAGRVATQSEAERVLDQITRQLIERRRNGE